MNQIGYAIDVILIISVISIGAMAKLFSSTPASQQSRTTAPSTVKDTKNSSGGISLTTPPGFLIHVFAANLGNPRDLEYSPGGTLLVSDPYSEIIYALPDNDKNGEADIKKIIIRGENHPHGLAFYKDKLYVAEATRVVRYKWDEANLTATKEKILFSLPENNDHNNRTITFDPSGKMYVSVGSTCNVCIESSSFSGSVIVSDSDGNSPKVFAKGLRNASFIQINPKTLELWSTEMGRDYFGDDLPPDEINIIRRGRNYGWPYCYGNKIHDDNFDPNRARTCNNTTPPIYEIPAHSAPLGLTFINSPQFPSDWQGDLLVAYHGSWNRSVPTGYKVVHLKVNGNSIIGSDDFITGFLPSRSLTGPSDSLGRPVDLIFDNRGNLYLSDDKSGNVYAIQKPETRLFF